MSKDEIDDYNLGCDLAIAVIGSVDSTERKAIAASLLHNIESKSLVVKGIQDVARDFANGGNFNLV